MTSRQHPGAWYHVEELSITISEYVASDSENSPRLSGSDFTPLSITPTLIHNSYV